MSARLRRRTVIAVVFLVGAALIPETPGRAQCMYPTHLFSPVFCYDMMPSGDRACIAQLRFMTSTGGMSNWGCTYAAIPTLMSPTDYSNVTKCTYIMAQTRLYAKRPMTGSPTMAFCQVSCTACGVLRIDEGDSLPVELMNFSVGEDFESDEGQDQNEQ